MNTTVRGPLRFKRRGQEITFGTNTVHTVELYESQIATISWKVEVNGIVIYKGTEKGARRQYDRALKYLR